MPKAKRRRPRRKCYYWIYYCRANGEFIPAGKHGKHITVVDHGFQHRWGPNGKWTYTTNVYQVNSLKKLDRILANLPDGVIVDRINNMRRGRFIVDSFVNKR